MASANWLKATTQKAGAMKKHLGQKERENGNHSNQDINISLSKQNYSIGCSDYSIALERMKTRTKEVDEVQPPKRIRKDRMTCCFIELPCPDELTQQGRSDEFFHKAYKVIQNFFGDSNVHGGFVHKDERHEYTDKDGKQRMSLEHMHTLVSAYTREKGINGKAFETKARLRAFNKALDEMCAREFGVHLNTGERADRKSVETLKQKSEARQELGELNKRIGELQRAEAESRDKFLEVDEKATQAEIRASTAEKRAEVAEQMTATAESKLQEINAQYDEANKELKMILDKKAKASKIPSLNLFSETVTYHKNTFEGVQRIGNEAYDRFTKANKALQQAKAIEARVEVREAAVAPLERKAQEEYKRAKELREKQEQLIEQRAEELAQTRVLQGMRGIATNRNQRLESYCRQLQFGDGMTVLDKFEELEREMERQALERTKISKRKNRSWER